MEEHPQDRNRFPRVWFLAAVATLAFAFQGSRGLWEPDEGRYVNTALQMIKTGEWTVPYRHHETQHLTKPPLTYWALAGSMTVFGRNEWAIRLPNALAFFLTVIAVWVMGRQFLPARPWLPALVYTSSALPFAAANIVTTDTLLTLWEALAALCFFRLRAEEEESRSWRWTLGMWAALGLGFLTKGPPALLVAAPMLFSSVLAGERKTARRMFRPAGLAAFLLIGCSWYVAVAIKVPGVLSYWIEDEVLARVASGQYRRNAAWYGGFVVYVPALILGSLPWTGHLLTGLPSAGRHLIRFRDAEHRRAHPETLLLTCWLVLALAVFFAARSRMYLYVLPLFIPLSILVSMRLRQSSFRPAWRVLLVAWLLLLVASRAAVAAYPHDKDSRSLARAIERIVPFRPAEAVFVDTAPAYGLSLYLDCEVECVSIRRRRDPRYDSTLSSELLEKEERLIFLVRPGDFDKFADLCAVRGKHLRTLGTHGRYSVHAFESELVGQPETPPAAPAGPRGEAQTIP